MSILVKWWLAAFNRATGRLIASETLIATAADSRNDVIATSAVLLSSLIAHYTGLYLDGWMGIAVAVFIIASGIGLVKDTLDPLLGSAPDPQLVQAIEEHIAGYPGLSTAMICPSRLRLRAALWLRSCRDGRRH